MGKYDEPEALGKTLFNLERDSQSLKRTKQDQIKTVTRIPNSDSMRKNEMQLFDNQVTDEVELFFKNENGTVFKTTLNKSEE